MANKRSRRRARIIVPKPDIVAPPGNIAPPQDSVTPKMSVITYGPDRIEERNIESIAALKELRAQGVLWLDIEGVGDAKTFNELGDLFGLHSLALEDVVNLHQRPKAEDYDDHAFVVLQMPTSNDTDSMEQLAFSLEPTTSSQSKKGWAIAWIRYACDYECQGQDTARC